MALLPNKALKFRASCDACGSVKLKCDRQRPACGRCEALSVTCVYGISRKNSKKLMAGHASSQTTQSELSGLERVFGSSAGGSGCDGGPRDPPAFSPTSSVRDEAVRNMAVASTGESTTDYSYAADGDTSMIGLDPIEWDSSIFSALPDVADAFQMPSAAPERGVGFGLPSPSTDQSHGVAANLHDCNRLADTILSSLSSIEMDPGAVSIDAPLDEILRVGRECCDGLKRLLLCSCPCKPHLLLMHASIISRIMTLYQRAAASLASMSRRAADGQVGSSVPSSSAFGLRPNTASATPQMVIGCFVIDDQQVQSALKGQLVLSELNKLSCIIDIFNAQALQFPGVSTDVGLHGQFEPVKVSILTWLRHEHARVTNSVSP